MIAVVVLSIWTELFSQGIRPIEIGDATGPSPNLSAKTCEPCHADEYREWQGSRHRLAWQNGLFQSDYRRGPRAWCRNCHAPLPAQQENVYENPLATEGVTCVACHMREGQMLARSKHSASPHDTRTIPDFGSPAFCAGCHQFNFPRFGPKDSFLGWTDEPMQNTVAQFFAHRRRESCLECHGTPSGHGFPGAHDLGMLRRALAMSACTSGAELRVTVENQGAGHNVPTGDVHRHVLLKVWRPTAPEALTELFLGRRFESTEDGGKKTIWDSTLAPGQRRTFPVKLATLGAAPNEPVSIELRYVYGRFEEPDVPLGEPAYQTIYLERRRPGRFAPCRP